MLTRALAHGVEDFDAFDRDEESVGDWFDHFVDLQCAEWNRGQLELSMHEIEPSTAGSTLIPYATSLVTLAEAIQSQDPDARLLLALRSWQDLPYWQIAQQLSIQEAAARQKFKRILDRFQSTLRDQGLDGDQFDVGGLRGRPSSAPALKLVFTYLGAELFDQETKQQIQSCAPSHQSILPPMRQRLIAHLRTRLLTRQK